MMNNVDDYIMVQNLIPIELCKSLIRENSLPEKKWSKHSWYSYREDDTHSVPDKELDQLISSQHQFKSLGPCLEQAVVNYQNKYSAKEGKAQGGWIKHIGQVKFNRYKVGIKMQTHYDHIQSMFDGKQKGIPILSFVGLLNDNYEGGEFICRKKEIKLKRGDILIFPSNFMYPHKVQEITKGIRYSFVTWGF